MLVLSFNGPLSTNNEFRTHLEESCEFSLSLKSHGSNGTVFREDKPTTPNIAHRGGELMRAASVNDMAIIPAERLSGHES